MAMITIYGRVNEVISFRCVVRSQPSGDVGLRRVVGRWVGRPTAGEPMIVPVVLAF